MNLPALGKPWGGKRRLLPARRRQYAPGASARQLQHATSPAGRSSTGGPPKRHTVRGSRSRRPGHAGPAPPRRSGPCAVVRRVRRIVLIVLRSISWSTRARMPRRMLTSSFSSAARANSRRSRGIRRRGISRYRKHIATSMRSACSCNPSISSCARQREVKAPAAQVASPWARPHASYAATCTAAARPSDANPGLAGMIAATGDAAGEVVVREAGHLGAEVDERACAPMRAPTRPRALPPRAPKARRPRTRAAARCSRSSTRRPRARHRANRRPAPRRDRDRAGGAPGRLVIGVARRRDQREARRSPIASIARAAAPTLPGWLGATSTTRTRSSVGKQARESPVGPWRTRLTAGMAKSLSCSPRPSSSSTAQTAPCIRCSRPPSRRPAAQATSSTAAHATSTS